MSSKTKKIKCSTLLVALLTALAVFVGNVGHTEYKSQMRKRKNKKEIVQEVIQDVEEVAEDVIGMDTSDTCTD